jgi:hypothetical protein
MERTHARCYSFEIDSKTSDRLAMQRVPQPPVNPASRDAERHDFWPGFVAGVIGFALVVFGARHLTAVETVDGGTAWETELTKAFAFSGLQYADKMAPKPPPQLEDPTAAAEALERWAKEQANATPPAWKIRVDTSAKTPCPT